MEKVVDVNINYDKTICIQLLVHHSLIMKQYEEKKYKWKKTLFFWIIQELQETIYCVRRHLLTAVSCCKKAWFWLTTELQIRFGKTNINSKKMDCKIYVWSMYYQHPTFIDWKLIRLKLAASWQDFVGQCVYISWVQMAGK